ncbi:hypothetical protein [Halopseudomonas salegens]|uniref:Uncharacterized protein n=1 Tax=Halopseudomonas salegens TaxID=1434072 RepID=A0A1H2EJ34_9GAMM|nr:hypothetical protein [Halopseudomonas salegens]SDT95182.1 hypothetical protein SAMN05216210_0778 [Halopseudomonas salegens]
MKPAADDAETSNPLDKAVAEAPPTLGSGCLARYDIDAMDDTLGADFSSATRLLLVATESPKDQPCS